jgi:hypothetical protein
MKTTPSDEKIAACLAHVEVRTAGHCGSTDTRHECAAHGRRDLRDQFHDAKAAGEVWTYEQHASFQRRQLELERRQASMIHDSEPKDAA